MFDMMKIGRHISELRREKDMTQMELADRLGISHQAVSKWERGESMPDVSTLPLLAEIFGTTVDGILDLPGDGQTAEAHTVRHVLDHTADEAVEKGDITLEDIGDVAPLLKPSQIDGMVTHIRKTSVGELAGIAPFVSREVLDRLAAKAAEVGGIGELCGIAPFVSREVLDMLAAKAAEVGGIGDLCGIAPFVSREVLDKLAAKATEVGGIGELCGIAPFVSREVLDKLAQKHYSNEE